MWKTQNNFPSFIFSNKAGTAPQNQWYVKLYREEMKSGIDDGRKSDKLWVYSNNSILIWNLENDPPTIQDYAPI